MDNIERFICESCGAHEFKIDENLGVKVCAYCSTIFVDKINRNSMNTNEYNNIVMPRESVSHSSSFGVWGVMKI